MHIAIFAGYYYPHVGGYCKNIHELARRLVARGYEVDVITCDTDSNIRYEVKDGVCIKRLPIFLHIANQVPVPFPFVLFKKYDVVITQTRIFPTSLIGAIYAKILRIPLIHVERGSYHSVVDNALFSWLIRVYDHTIGWLIMALADKRVGISKATVDFISHLRKSESLLIYNGIIDVNGLRKGNNQYRIVFVGRLIYAKGVQDLIEAFNLVDNDNLELVIVGDGVYRDNLEIMASQLRCKNRIRFTGEVSQESVIDILKECDIFVNPSYSEGLPTTVMEAASVGLPIIATDVGGTNEIIEDDSGILISPGNIKQLKNSLNWMLNNYSEAEKMGRKVREDVKKFNWEEIADQWDKLLKEVV